MSRLRLTDILCELIELGHERVTEVRQQLVYYRASVYKTETAAQISASIAQLRLVGGLFGDDAILDVFKDYDVMSSEGMMNHVPGECSFSKRVSSLVVGIIECLERLHGELVSRGAVANDSEFADEVRKYRTQLLALCRQGTRQWAFFEAL